ncbi:MAG: DUF4848 domain-containing protein [Bacteroidales bacterium]|nr:DUF4848 domain-containing protein [Bacteroidales bacterium]
MKNKLNYLMISVIIVLFSQCTKENNLSVKETNTSDKVIVENKRLVFNDKEILNRTLEKLLNMNTEELVSWYKQNDFESMWLIYNKAYNELEKLTTDTEIYKFVNKYQEYFEIVIDENGEVNLVEKIDNPLYARIVNKNGEYTYKGKVNKIIGNKLISINEEDYSVIKNLKASDIIEIAKNDEQIELFDLTGREASNIFKSGNCGSSKEATYTRDERRCKHDRKVTLNIGTYVIYNSFRSVYIVAAVYGKRKFGCIWSRYKTALSLRNVSFSVRYQVIGQLPGGGAAYDYYSSTIPNSDIESNELVKANYKDDILISSYKHSYFTRVSGKATSRGVGSNWAVIDCK